MDAALLVGLEASNRTTAKRNGIQDWFSVGGVDGEAISWETLGGSVFSESPSSHTFVPRLRKLPQDIGRLADLAPVSAYYVQ